MRFILRLLGLSVAAFLTVVFATATFLFIQKVWFGRHHASPMSKYGYVAVLNVGGVMLSATSTLKDLEAVLDDPMAKALVVRINSPGGMVAPAQELYEAFRRADKKIPVIISMGSVAASGGYYASLGGRKIFANPGTLTASVGVIMEYVNLEKLYQWAKIERYALYSGKLKAAGSEFRPMTPEEKALFMGMLEDIHGQFKAAVKERRKLTDEEIEHWCDGRAMTGQQAKAAKFVDSLGPLEAALSEAKAAAHLPESADVVYLEKEEGMLKKLFLGDTESGTGSTLAGLFGLLSHLPPAPLTPGWRVLLLSPVTF